ncbi:peroxiredoxin [Flavobacteriaceae bacterium UJ101]|nr:peroxiredoxin [Flavobacteriaceae bacterium UJ101]
MKKSILFLTFLVSVISFAQVAEKAEAISPLLIGEEIPESSLINLQGEKENTSTIFDDKKTILIVYRGGWCPFCNAQLSDLGAIQQQFVDLGYQIIAISPDSFESEAKTFDKNELSYQLFSDNSTEFIQKLGIAFQAPKKYGKMLLKSSDGKNEKVLPAPSVFIVDENKTILFEYISPNYKNRMDGTLLLTVAQHFAKK